MITVDYWLWLGLYVGVFGGFGNYFKDFVDSVVVSELIRRLSLDTFHISWFVVSEITGDF